MAQVRGIFRLTWTTYRQEAGRKRILSWADSRCNPKSTHWRSSSTHWIKPRNQECSSGEICESAHRSTWRYNDLLVQVEEVEFRREFVGACSCNLTFRQMGSSLISEAN
jgi:hypothetical protein